MKEEEYYHYSYFKNPSHLAEKCLFVSDACGYTADRDFRIDRKTFYNYRAFYVRKGTFHLEQYGKKYVFHAGDGAIISLVDQHLYYSDESDMAHLLWFHFRGAGAGALMEWLGSSGLLPYCYHDEEKEKFFEEIFRLTQKEAGETAIAGHIYRTLTEILSDQCFCEKEDESVPRELRQAVQFMEANCSENLTLERISKEVNMGKYHFSHMFRKYYGVPPIQYFNSRKMEMVCRLLMESDDSIEKIAERMGYRDQAYFRKAFKSYFGITPSAYRKARR